MPWTRRFLIIWRECIWKWLLPVALVAASSFRCGSSTELISRSDLLRKLDSLLGQERFYCENRTPHRRRDDIPLRDLRVSAARVLSWISYRQEEGRILDHIFAGARAYDVASGTEVVLLLDMRRMRDSATDHTVWGFTMFLPGEPFAGLTCVPVNRERKDRARLVPHQWGEFDGTPETLKPRWIVSELIGMGVDLSAWDEYVGRRPAYALGGED